MSNSDTDMVVRRYVVCLLDVLGQKCRLCDWATLPEGPEDASRFEQAVRDSAIAVREFRDLFTIYFDQFRERTSEKALDSLPEAQKQRHRRFKGCSVAVERFSDTFLFYSPLPNTHGDDSPDALHAILYACCNALLTSLAVDVPLRGAITIGTGTVLPDGGFYGPALAEVHHLESKLAGHPRVLVSTAVRDFLQEGHTYSTDPDMARLMARLAADSRQFLWQDIDGLWTVDFLGKAHRELVRDISKAGVLIRRAYTFARSSAAEFRQRGDAKLAVRYYLLQQYIESRLGIWGVLPSPTATALPATGSYPPRLLRLCSGSPRRSRPRAGLSAPARSWPPGRRRRRRLGRWRRRRR